MSATAREDWPVAEAALRNFLERAPDDPCLHFNLARILRRLGRTEDALHSARASLDRHAIHQGALFEEAACLMDLGVPLRRSRSCFHFLFGPLPRRRGRLRQSRPPAPASGRPSTGTGGLRQGVERVAPNSACRGLNSCAGPAAWLSERPRARSSGKRSEGCSCRLQRLRPVLRHPPAPAFAGTGSVRGIQHSPHMLLLDGWPGPRRAMTMEGFVLTDGMPPRPAPRGGLSLSSPW